MCKYFVLMSKRHIFDKKLGYEKRNYFNSKFTPAFI